MEVGRRETLAADVTLAFITHQVDVGSITRAKLLMNASGHLLLWREEQAHQDQRCKICAKHCTDRPMLWAEKLRPLLRPGLRLRLANAHRGKAKSSSQNCLRPRHSDPIQAKHCESIEHYEHERCRPAGQGQCLDLTPSKIRSQPQQEGETSRESDGPCGAPSRNAQPAECHTGVCVMPSPPKEFCPTHIVGSIEDHGQQACKARFC
mmetsp:Transcript_15841/g.25905  ORF Transcript_15841/g.25905 Transcript_15841/m.25905 type:complete len:207 (-) Transcript_15841:64-684(-)